MGKAEARSISLAAVIAAVAITGAFLVFTPLGLIFSAMFGVLLGVLAHTGLRLFRLRGPRFRRIRKQSKSVGNSTRYRRIS